MENMEKATNVNKENWITLSSTGTIWFTSDELVSGTNFSIFAKNEELFKAKLLLMILKVIFCNEQNNILKKMSIYELKSGSIKN